MAVVIETASEATDELLGALYGLLRQLSSSAAALTSERLDELLGSPMTTLFIARDNDAIVGMLTLVIFSLPSGRRAWIEDVVVDESVRGAGVGRALTQAAIDKSVMRGVRSIDLTSRPSREEANALYQKMGFDRRETNVYRLSL